MLTPTLQNNGPIFHGTSSPHTLDGPPGDFRPVVGVSQGCRGPTRRQETLRTLQNGTRLSRLLFKRRSFYLYDCTGQRVMLNIDLTSFERKDCKRITHLIFIPKGKNNYKLSLEENKSNKHMFKLTNLFPDPHLTVAFTL